MSQTVAELSARLYADTASFVRGMKQSEAALGKLAQTADRAGKDMSSWSDRLDKATRATTRTLGSASLAVTGLFAGIAAKGISMNSSLEKSTLQFTTLFQAQYASLGDAAIAARKHVDSLFRFAAATPFETGPVIEASKQLQTFGITADAQTKKITAAQRAAGQFDGALTLVGDAAAASSKDITELAMWYGRMYSAIQAGRPFGEAAQRLQEMTVLTPQARNKLEDLQKTGGQTAAMINILNSSFGRFSGAMDRQAKTWEGLTSTLSDLVNLGAAKVFEDGYRGAKQMLIAVTDLFSSPFFQDKVIPAAAAQMKTLGRWMDKVAEGINHISDYLNASTAPWSAFSHYLDDTAGAAGKLVPVLGALVAAMGYVRLTSLPLIGRILPAFGGALLIPAAALIGLTIANRDAQEALVRLGKTVSGAILPILPALAKSLGTIVDVAGQFLAAGLRLTAMAVEFIAPFLVIATQILPAIVLPLQLAAKFATLLADGFGLLGPVGEALAGVLALLIARNILLNKVMQEGAFTRTLVFWTDLKRAIAGAAASMTTMNAAAAKSKFAALGSTLANGFRAAMGPQAAVLAGMAALYTGYRVWKNNVDSQRKSFDDTSQAAGKLAKSYLDVQRAMDAADPTKAAAAQQRFLKVNQNEIFTLSKLAKAHREVARARLTQVGYKMVQSGSSPAEAMAALRKLALSAGIEIPVSIDEESIAEAKEYINSFSALGKKVSTEWGGYWSGIGTKTKKTLSDVGKSAQEAFSAGQMDVAIASLATFQKELEGTKHGATQLNYTFDEFAKSFGKGFGLSLDSTTDLRSAIDQLANNTNSHATPAQKEYLRAILAAADGHKELVSDAARLQAAVQDVGSVNEYLARSADAATAQLAREAMAQEAFTKSSLMSEEAIKAVTEAMAKQLDVGTALSATMEKIAAKNGVFDAALDAGKVKDGGFDFKAFFGEIAKQTKDMAAFEANLAKIRKTFPELADALAAKGPEAAGAVAKFASSNNANLDKVNKAFTKTRVSALENVRMMTEEITKQIAAAQARYDNYAALTAAGFGGVAEKLFASGDFKGMADAVALLKTNTSTARNALKELNAAVATAAAGSKTYTGQVANAIATIYKGVKDGTIGSVDAVKEAIKASGQDSTAVLDGLKRLLKTIPDKHVKVIIDAIAPKDVITIPIRYAANDHAVRGTGVLNANGNIFNTVRAFAQGSEDHRAQIAGPGTMRVWAEPETGGEAYIPLAEGKRGRSMAILSQVAKRFGYRLSKFANGGGFTPDYGSGTKTASGGPSFVDPASIYTSLVSASKSGKVSLDAFTASLEKSLRVERVWRGELEVVARKTTPAIAAALQAMGADGAALVHQFATASGADLRRLTKDFAALHVEVSKPLTITDYIARLAQMAKEHRWAAADIKAATKKVGADVVEYLQQMGAEGEAIIHLLATATGKQARQIRAAVESMMPTNEDAAKAKAAAEKAAKAYEVMSAAAKKMLVGLDYLLTKPDAVAEKFTTMAASLSKAAHDKFGDEVPANVQATIDSLSSLGQQAQATHDALTSAFKGLGSMSKALDRYHAAVAKAAEAEAEGRRAHDEYAASIKSSFSPLTRLNDLFSVVSTGAFHFMNDAFQWQQDEKRVFSIDAMRDGLKARLAAAREFSANLKAIAAKGGSKAMLDEIIGLGPDGGAQLAKELAGASADTIREISSMQDEIMSVADTVSGSLADSFMAPPVVAAVQSLGAVFADTMRDAIAQMTRFSTDIAELAKRGLAPAMIAEIVAMGPEAGLEFAEGILAGGSEAIADLNTISKTLEDSIATATEAIEHVMFDAGVRWVDSIADGMTSELGKVQEIVDQIAAMTGQAQMSAHQAHVAHEQHMAHLANQGLSAPAPAAPAPARTLSPHELHMLHLQHMANTGQSVTVAAGAVQVNVQGQASHEVRAAASVAVNDAFNALVDQLRGN